MIAKTATRKATTAVQSSKLLANANSILYKFNEIVSYWATFLACGFTQ